MLFIGPNDLSLALGFPPSIPHATNPKVQEVIAEILAATLKAGKLVSSAAAPSPKLDLTA